MPRSRATVLAAVLLAGAALAASPRGAQAAENHILCGGSPGGLWSLLGAGLDAAVKADDPASTVTYQTSSGGFANIVQITTGKCDLAIAHVGEAVMARAGAKPYPAPIEGFSAIAVLYDWAPMQWLAAKDWAETNGIRSLADIAVKKPQLDLVVNRRGILPSILAERALELSGVGFDDIEAWGGSVQYAGSKAAAEIMSDRKADLWVNAMFVGGARIRSMAEARDLTLLEVAPEVSEAMARDYGSIPWTVEAGAYPWQERDAPTFGARAVLLVSDAAAPEKIQALTATLLRHLDKLQSVHKAMAPLNPALMASLKAAPYHPGARAAYEAAGY